MKKNVFFCIAMLLLLATGIMAQTAETLTRLDQVSIYRAAPSPWFGAKLQFPVLGGESEFDFSYGLTAKLIFSLVERERLSLYLVGNLSPIGGQNKLKALAGDEDDGLSVGLQPVYSFGGQTRLHLFGQGLLKFSEISPDQDIRTFHITGGIEVSLPAGFQDSPFSVSIYAKRIFAGGKELFFAELAGDDQFWQYSGIAVIPVADKTGLMAQADWVQGMRAQVRLGIVLAASL